MSVLTQFVLTEISGKTAIGFSVTGIVNLTMRAHVSMVGWKLRKSSYLQHIRFKA